MRISSLVAGFVIIGSGFGLVAPGWAFDGRHTPDGATVSVPGDANAALGAVQPLPTVPLTDGKDLHAPLTGFQALRSGAQALRAGKTEQAVTALQYAADRGVAAAQWKLGRMYADGDGVDEDKLRAFEYFRSIANAHADDNPTTPQARFVANAFVALGHFYLEGIPNSRIEPDVARARAMYFYAASYFGDAEAQYRLGRLYLKGAGGMAKDPRLAARWLRLAARKGHHQAQALLGNLLFDGQEVGRQAALGLMWLTIAKDSASPKESWINELYNKAFKQASDDQRAMAFVYLESWMKNRRE